MTHAYRFSSVFGCLAAGLGMATAACSGTGSSEDVVENVGLTSSALSVCNETVPANRNVDGFPAYAQCADSNNAAIYSNNGIDTSTTQMGSDWVRTQWSGGYQCTEFAHRYLYFKWNVKWIPNGNAGMWCDTQPPANSGIVQTMTPVHGDIMVLAPGSCGADATTGHVNIIDQVNDAKLVAVEQNGARRGNYMLSCGKCFLHVMANDGSGKPAAGGAAGAGAAASSPATGSPGAPGAPGSSGPQGGQATAGAAAPSSGRPQRPSMGFPQTAAGAAAPGGAPTAAAGSGAAATRTPVSTTPTAAPSTPLVNTSAAAGSGAIAPLAGAVTAAPAAPSAAPAASGCSVAAVGGLSLANKRDASLPLALALSLLGGVILRSRRRNHD